MFSIDTPLLALLLRFVVNTDHTQDANDEFLESQIKTIKMYLTRFPAHEQGPKVMEWIEQHAARFRHDWQRRTVSNRILYLRCEDCPLAGMGAAEHCEIHEQWQYLLTQYIKGEVTSRSYIESALELLQGYKDELKLRVDKHAEPKVEPKIEPMESDKKDEKKKKKKKKKKDKSKKSKKNKKLKKHERNVPEAKGSESTLPECKNGQCS